MAKSRDKGKRTENELAQLLKLGLSDRTVRRNLEQSAEGGVDLVGKSLRHFALEAKAGEHPRWSDWMKQAEEQAEEGQWPVLCRREQGGNWAIWVRFNVPGFCQVVKFYNLLRDGKHV